MYHRFLYAAPMLLFVACSAPPAPAPEAAAPPAPAAAGDEVVFEDSFESGTTDEWSEPAEEPAATESAATGVPAVEPPQ